MLGVPCSACDGSTPPGATAVLLKGHLTYCSPARMERHPSRAGTLQNPVRALRRVLQRKQRPIAAPAPLCRQPCVQATLAHLADLRPCATARETFAGGPSGACASSGPAAVKVKAVTKAGRAKMSRTKSRGPEMQRAQVHQGLRRLCNSEGPDTFRISLRCRLQTKNWPSAGTAMMLCMWGRLSEA